MQEIEIFKGSEYYGKFLKSFYDYQYESRELDLKSDKVTKAIFYHLYKTKSAEWEMRTNFKLKIKPASSDYFRNLLAFYLNTILSDELEILLEHGEDHPTKKTTNENKKKKIRPDILIKNKDKYIFAIEIKTSIGWDREMKDFEERLDDISKTFNIPDKKIIYIFQSATNVNKDFEKRYWDHEKSEPKEQRPKDLPYSKIYPLFYHSPDPYYWEESKDIDRDKEVKIFDESAVIEKAGENIICKFEDIIKMVLLYS